jgi:hypothetical protein
MPAATTVTINATPTQVTYLWCEFKRARKILIDSVRAHDNVGVGFATGWIDSLLDELVDWFPSELDPLDSNPSQKP